MKRAWVGKVRRIKAARRAFLAQGRVNTLPARLAVGGTMSVPVLAGYFSDETAPYAIGALQDKLFDNPSGTVTDYWGEVSYGNLTMTGSTFGWTALSNNNDYYAGFGNGTNPLTDRTGELIKELLDAHDAAVDFGQFDNDGPDGVPNSGDDDGFVDFVTIVHSREGGECDTLLNNIWSHRWIYSRWNASGGLPYSTNDLSNASGVTTIQVDDYAIVPAYNCGGTTMIDIGVFCHEFGHALGLPDLYDTGHASKEGIGHWGIMGSGNWNLPSSPAHPCAWTRKELGWVVPVDADWTGASTPIPDINTNAYVARLAFTDDRFRRSTQCPIAGAYSLYCGLTPAEASARGWVDSGPGYGSSWRETIARAFRYDGTGPVNLTYDYAHDLEVTYDFAYTVVDVKGTETVLATYTGTGAGADSVELSAYLGALSPGDSYTIKFRVDTDFSFANDDGDYASNCGALSIDNVSVVGGGENYATDFESYADGWFQHPSDNEPGEYWLIENRRATGYDQHLHADGLLIFHVDESVLDSAGQVNDGGESGTIVRGLVLEEADGLFNLNEGTTNRGQASDPYPGTTNNRNFTPATIPGSVTNSGRASVTSATEISDAMPTMTANLRGGDGPPFAGSVTPDTLDNDQPLATVAVGGDAIRPGATFAFRKGATSFEAMQVEWVDPTRVTGKINTYGRNGGAWDLVVTNPDGQSVSLTEALVINPVITAAQLVSASIAPRGDRVELFYVLRDVEEGEALRLYRSKSPDDGYVTIVDPLQPSAPGQYTYTDADVVPGQTYYYLLGSRTVDGEVRELHRGRAVVAGLRLSLAQNAPNPFNPETLIRFFLPKGARATLEVYGVDGRRIARLVDRYMPAGWQTVRWNGTDDGGRSVASGLYLYRLEAAGGIVTRKMMLVK